MANLGLCITRHIFPLHHHHLTLFTSPPIVEPIMSAQWAKWWAWLRMTSTAHPAHWLPRHHHPSFATSLPHHHLGQHNLVTAQPDDLKRQRPWPPLTKGNERPPPAPTNRAHHPQRMTDDEWPTTTTSIEQRQMTSAHHLRRQQVPTTTSHKQWWAPTTSNNDRCPPLPPTNGDKHALS